MRFHCECRWWGALLNKGVLLHSLKRSSEAIAAFSDLVERFGKTEDVMLKNKVVTALVNKGIAFHHLNRNEEAIRTYDEVVRRFGDANEMVLREQVSKAICNRSELQQNRQPTENREINMSELANFKSYDFEEWKRAIERDEKLRSSVLLHPSDYYKESHLTEREIVYIIVKAAMLEISDEKTLAISKDTCAFLGVPDENGFKEMLTTLAKMSKL